VGRIGKWQGALSVGVLFLVSGSLGYLASSGLDALPGVQLSWSQIVVVIVALVLVYLLCIAAHEAGHVLGGRLAGFRTLLFIVGPLRIERTVDGFTAGLNRSVMLAGGLAAMVPAGLHDLRRRTIVMVAGGPMVSLMLGAQLLAVYQATSPFLVRPDGALAAHLVALTLAAAGGMSLLIGMLTLLPSRTGGFYSDGARMLRLMRTSEDAEREVALIALTAMSVAGTRPREWDSALVARIAGIRDGGPFEVGGLQFAFAHALDRGDIDEARNHLEAALHRIGQLPPSARSSLLFAGATFFALFDADAPRARALLADAHDGPLSAPHRRRLAQAAISLAEGDVASALAAARTVPPLAARSFDRGAAVLDEALAARILAAD
jgi:hypothetical protein